MHKRLEIAIVGTDSDDRITDDVCALGHIVCEKIPPEHATKRVPELRADVLLVDFDDVDDSQWVKCCGIPIIFMVGERSTTEDLLHPEKIGTAFALLDKSAGIKQLRLNIDTVRYQQLQADRKQSHHENPGGGSTEHDSRNCESNLLEKLALLEDRSRLMDTIFETMSDGVVVVDQKGNFTLFNKSAERLVGLGASNTSPDEWAEHYGLFHLDKVTPFLEEDLPLVRAINGKVSNNVDIFVRNLGARQGVFISVDGRPLLDAAGKVSGGLAVIRDMSQDIAAKEAFFSGRMEIVDTILHNIGNAMNSVTVGADTLFAELGNNRLISRLSTLADTISTQGDNAVSWLKNDQQGQQAIPFLLALAKDIKALNNRLFKIAYRMRDRVRHIEGIIRTQRSMATNRIEPQIINLARQINDAITVLSEMLNKRGIIVDVDCKQAPENIRTCESRFHQMLVNLIRNAIEALDEKKVGGFDLKSNGEEPRIKIDSKLESEYLIIEITDNGIGISPVHMREIFSAGYTTKKSGTGLGLHSAANFAIAHGGRITPHSPGIGLGTTMRVTLRSSMIMLHPTPPQPPV